MNTAGNNSHARGTLYGMLAAIGFAHLLNDMIQSVIPAIYPVLKDKFAFTFAEIGLITLFFQLTSSILQPLTGWYADRRPYPYALAVGMCFTLLGLCLLAVAGSFVTILLAVSLIGCGSSVFHPGASRVAQLASGGKKSMAQSIFQVGGNGGSALGPLVAALLVIPYGQGAIGWFALVALAAIGVLARIGRWYSRVLRSMQTEAAALRQTVVSLSRSKVRWSMVILIVLIFSKYFYISSMTSYFTFFLIEKFGVSVQQSQFCLFAFLAALAVGTLVGGVLGDRYGRKYVILGSIFGAAPFALLLPYTGLALTILLSVIIGLVIASAFSAILVYATDLMPDKVGMIAGIFFGLMFGLGGVGSAFFGWLADRTSIEFIFHISTLLPLLGIVACFLPNIKNKPAA
ncbi:MAG: MFS transporter [Clostridium sp.]|nr:MFS transporter [Clostridium sp.]